MNRIYFAFGFAGFFFLSGGAAIAGEIGSFNQYGHTTRTGSGTVQFTYTTNTQVTEQSSGSTKYKEWFSLGEEDRDDDRHGQGNGHAYGRDRDEDSRNSFKAESQMSLVRNLTSATNEQGSGQEQFSFTSTNFRSEQGIFSR